MSIAYIGLGANLGQPITTITLAEHRIGDLPGVVIRRRAPLYRTAPQGFVDQPDFVNSVIEIETEAEPNQLLAWLKQIEAELGRLPTIRWGPRTIDLDLLLFGDEHVASPVLTIPHPSMWQRLFVLEPLSELRPDLHDPSGRPIGEVCEALRDSQPVRRIEAGAG